MKLEKRTSLDTQEKNQRLVVPLVSPCLKFSYTHAQRYGTHVFENYVLDRGTSLIRSCAPPRTRGLQGYLAHKKDPPSLGPPQDPRFSPTVGSYEGVFLRGGVILYDR